MNRTAQSATSSVITKLFGCLLLAYLSGCATPTLNKEQCLLSNWQDIGYQDGLKGHNYLRIEQHQKACAEHGQTVDSSLYRAGHEQGIQQYCHSYDHYRAGRGGSLMNKQCGAPEHVERYRAGIHEFCRSTNAYLLGSNGKKYHNVCDTHFSALYQEGKKLHKLTVKANKIDKRIERLRRENTKTDDKKIMAENRAQIKKLDKELKIVKTSILAEKLENKEHFSSTDLLLDVYGATK